MGAEAGVTRHGAVSGVPDVPVLAVQVHNEWGVRWYADGEHIAMFDQIEKRSAFCNWLSENGYAWDAEVLVRDVTEWRIVPGTGDVS
jgi:hypothetical protein